MPRGKNIKWNPEELRRLYWEEELSCSEIAEKLGLDKSRSEMTVYCAIRRFNIPIRNRKERDLLVSKKGKRAGKKSATFKGGRYQSQRGYIWVLVGPRKYRPEHQLVWERAYGEIPKGYLIHHLNGIRNDNRLENLIAMPKRQHGKEGPTRIKVLQKRIRELEDKIKKLKEKLEKHGN